jgi:hypothetical protein
MSQMGIDIAWDRPSVADIKKTGATWVARYFSTDPTKDLLPQEVKDYIAAGLGIVTVYETTTGRALQGHAAGVTDARAAVAERASVGLPNTAPIHWAVDTDADYASVSAYAEGWATVIPKDMTGPYGGIKVVDGAHAAGFKYGWQTTAWSGGQWSRWATIKQTGGTVLSGGADVDYAEVPDFGQFPTPEEIVTPQDKQDIANLVKAELPFAVWAYAHGAIDKPDMHQVVDDIAVEAANTAATVKSLETQLKAVMSHLGIPVA